MNDAPLFDLSQLNELSGGNQDFVNKMAGMFVDMVPEILDRINTGLATDNLEDMGAAAHKIKPSIDMMGIVSLKEKIRALESNGKNRTNLDEIPGLVSDINEILNKVVAQLRAR